MLGCTCTNTSKGPAVPSTCTYAYTTNGMHGLRNTQIQLENKSALSRFRGKLVSTRTGKLPVLYTGITHLPQKGYQSHS